MRITIFLLIVMSLFSCSICKCADNVHEHIAQESRKWDVDYIKKLLDSDERVKYKNIVSIMQPTPLQLIVLVGNIGHLSGNGQAIIMQFDEKSSKWVIKEVNYADG